MRTHTEYQTTTNSKIYRRIRREIETGCSRCPAHDGENRTRGYKHPIKKEWQLNPTRRHRVTGHRLTI